MSVPIAASVFGVGNEGVSGVAIDTAPRDLLIAIETLAGKARASTDGPRYPDTVLSKYFGLEQRMRENGEPVGALTCLELTVLLI